MQVGDTNLSGEEAGTSVGGLFGGAVVTAAQLRAERARVLLQFNVTIRECLIGEMSRVEDTLCVSCPAQ